MPMSIAGGPDIPAQALVGPDVITMGFVVRTTTPPSSMVAAVRGAIASIDPNIALADVRTLQAIVDRASDQMAFTMVLIAIAASVALILGVIGIYGVMSYIVTQRTGEIGVRLALGAEPARRRRHDRASGRARRDRRHRRSASVAALAGSRLIGVAALRRQHARPGGLRGGHAHPAGRRAARLLAARAPRGGGRSARRPAGRVSRDDTWLRLVYADRSVRSAPAGVSTWPRS